MENQQLQPKELLERISQFVTESRELVKSGAMMDVAELEKKVAELCDMVLALSQEDRVRFADELQVLLADIGKLGEEMTGLRDSIGDEIRSLSDVKKASVAYRVVDASDGYGKKNNDDSES